MVGGRKNFRVTRRSGFLTCSLSYFRRMNHGDACVTLEVVQIEAEDRVHLVNGHCSNDSSIVDLDPRDSVPKYEPSPSRENLRRLRKKSQQRLKAIYVSSCLFRSKAETVGVGRPRRGVPEFDEVLRKT